MIRHALTLEHIASALQKACVGSVLGECWTQEKNTIDLSFHNKHSTTRTNATHFLHVDLDPIIGGIQLRSETHRARKNSVDLFLMLIDKKCTGVKSVVGDRVLTFSFGTDNLHVLLYSGGKANIVLERSGVIADALHNKKQLTGTPSMVKPGSVVLGKHYGTLHGSEEKIIQACRATTNYFVLQHDNEVLFSLLPIGGWDVELQTQDVFEAIRVTVSKRRFGRRYTELHTKIERTLQRDRAKHAKAIDAMLKEAGVGDRAEGYRHTADLLLSQPDQSVTGIAKQTIVDWDGSVRTVELEPTLTLIENAQRYYGKARRAEAAALERSERLPLTQKRLLDVEQRLQQLQNITDISELEAMAKTTPDSPGQEPATRYREFDLGDGYVLYVGRNAANNDELTMKFAKQNDLWLHARGSSGSHAVLRNSSGETKIPKKILELAAEVTAYYSGARNASWTPVVYTQRKNVRKPKGAHVGAVVLEREDVIMVKPSLPSKP